VRSGVNQVASIHWLRPREPGHAIGALGSLFHNEVDGALVCSCPSGLIHGASAIGERCKRRSR
jgi:hypothetical protein